MLKNLQKRNQGFTIVEVMIVLAIAGLIILVVLLAVPALQRNSRNTTIKNDASSIAGAVNESVSSNNGRQPTAVNCAAGVVTVTNTTPVTGKVQGGTTCQPGAAVPTIAGDINISIGVKCDVAGTGPGAANGRAVAILYNTETSAGLAPQCLDS